MSKPGLEQPLNRRNGRISAAAVFMAMIAFTAGCSSESDTPEESTTTTTTTTTEPSLTPTEKAPNPNAPNDPFTPPVVAPQPTLDQDRDDYGH